MKQFLFWLFIAVMIIVIILLYARSLMKKTTGNVASGSGTAVQQIAQLLLSKGARKDMIPVYMAQMAFETAHFTSAVFKEDNNAGGIKFINNQSKQKAARGRKAGYGEGDYYAHYENYSDFVNDWMRVMRLGVRPIDATTAADFVSRLKQNGYFTSSATTYTNNVVAISQMAQYQNLV